MRELMAVALLMMGCGLDPTKDSVIFDCTSQVQCDGSTSLLGTTAYCGNTETARARVTDATSECDAKWSKCLKHVCAIKCSPHVPYQACE